MRWIVMTFVLAGSGCGAFSFPFSGDSEGSIALPLGVMSAGCEGSGSERLENGEVVSYTHHRMGPMCIVDAQWRGPLFDMDALRDDAEARMREEGVDPGDVRLTITSIDIEIVDVTVRDAATNDPIELRVPGTYRAAIHAAGDEIITVTPEETQVHDSNALVELANAAYQDRAEIPGEAFAHVVIDMTQIEPVVDARKPALSLRYEIAVEGKAALK